eukprot:18430_1
MFGSPVKSVSSVPRPLISEELLHEISKEFNFFEDDDEQNENFVFSKSLKHEMRLIFNIFITTSFGYVLEMMPQFVGKMFVGNISNTNSSLLLSAVGLSQNYANITGFSIGWGLTTALLTLIPQCIGSNRKDLLPNYVQRAFLVTFVFLSFSVILQIYSGDILCYILGYHQNEICHYIKMYNICLIPWLFFAVWLSILQRVLQNLEHNAELLIIMLVSNIWTPLWNYLFLYYFKIGYLGTAITQNITMLCAVILSVIYLCFKGYSYIFVPISLKTTLKFEKIKEFLSLAIPGLVRVCAVWWIAESVCVLSGYIADPYISLSTILISYSILQISSMFAQGLSVAVNVRVGLYIGYGSIKYSKRAAKAAVILAAIFIILIETVLLSLRVYIPHLYTTNNHVIALVSRLIYFVAITIIFSTFFYTFSGIFQGLGKQAIVAIVMFISTDILGFGSMVVCLFAFNFKRSTQSGVNTIIVCLLTGYISAGLIIMLILIIKNKVLWRRARKESMWRITTAKNEAQVGASINNDTKNVHHLEPSIQSKSRPESLNQALMMSYN